MDMVPTETLSIDVDLDKELSSAPDGAEFGKLPNGLTYYVRRNAKPKMRAALALAVKVGSVFEEENERGVAHIVEHLAFSATKSYTNHEIVKFLESIGASFGACGNAYTSFDETVYELFVPIDDPQLLSKAISILAEFSSEIRLAPEDLEKERGTVLEEYRQRRGADGRLFEKTWACVMKGSKYAERLPIGLEDVIRTVTSEVAQKFYRRWYNMQHMALVAVGDFPDAQAVIELIREHFEPISSADRPFNPVFEVSFHEEPRYSCIVESEASGTSVEISWKMPNDDLKTVKDYRDFLIESMFASALNRRFSKIIHKKDPPYFSCSAEVNESIRPMKGLRISSCCRERGIIEALESIITEVARIRLHEFSEREISIVKAEMLSAMESAYLEREQKESTSLRSAYLQHFLRNATVLGTETNAQLCKTILPQISASEVSNYAKKLIISHSCVIVATEPRATIEVGELKTAVSKITSLEEQGTIARLEEDHIPEHIVVTKPVPGVILQQTEYSELEVTELILSNGMKVCYKCTDFKNDQVVFRGYAVGGYSELLEHEYLSGSMSLPIAEEIGTFGYKPTVLVDMLAGKRAGVDTSCGPYTRSFYGDCSPSDLETALQLVYQLFVTNVEAVKDDVERVKQILEEIINAQERNPFTAFAKRVTRIKYGNSYFCKPWLLSDLPKIDHQKACEQFSNYFKDPSTFTVVIVGNIDPDVAHPLIMEYLGGIPAPSSPVLQFDYDGLNGIPCIYPAKTIREVVRSPMVEAQCIAYISFGVTIQGENITEEVYFMNLLCQLLETKMTEVLRFQHGQIYSVSVSSDFDYSKPSRTEDLCGDIDIYFSCSPEASSSLVDIALNELSRLQEHGPSEEDVSSLLEIEQRSYENGLEENYQWLFCILRSYRSRFYCGDVDNVHKALSKSRTRVLKSLNPLTAKWALQGILPFPCKDRYVAVSLIPETNLLRLLGYKISNLKPTGLAIYSKVIDKVWKKVS